MLKEKERVAKTNFDTSFWQVLCYFKPGGATQMALASVILGPRLFVIKSIHQSGLRQGRIFIRCYTAFELFNNLAPFPTWLN